MRFTSDLKTTLAIPFLTVVLAGCGDLIEDGPTCDGVRMIEDNTDASIAAGDIVSAIGTTGLIWGRTYCACD